MNIAILIDAENVLPAHADLIFGHAQKLGNVVCKEIFGAASALSTWVAPVLKYAIHPNLTIKAAKGKNSSDIALVIGAMDLLVAGNIDTAIIASSDSDFSSLSVRLRNAGINVIGMGTDKANALWRTACTSFVVLQPPKPAQASKQPAQPARQQQPQPQQQEARAEAPKQTQSRKQAAKPVTTTHAERTAVIGQLIAKRLESHGGRLQTSTLFPTLNRLPEYQVDRQGSGKKPLNYLTSTFSDTFHFEDTPDGKNWVSLLTHDSETADAAPAQADPAAEAEELETPVAEAEANVPEQPEPEPEQAAPEQQAPAVQAVEAVAEQTEEESYATPQEIADRLVAGGFEPDIARQVTDIFADSTSYRAAYNRLRSVFGNNAGRDYYQSAKRILTGEA